MGRVLALDYGKKRIGFATGDLDLEIAFPGGVIFNEGDKKAVVDVLAKFEELGCSMIIVGLPLNMDHENDENQMTTEVRYFVSELRKALGEDKVRLMDERLSSYEAKELMRDIAEKTGEEISLPRDAYAAQVILQRFFETGAQ